jgi:hypothetical protein
MNLSADLFDPAAKGGMIALTLADYIRQAASINRWSGMPIVPLPPRRRAVPAPIFGGLIEIGRGTQDTPHRSVR